MSIWEECPECGALGKIDREQYLGDVSVVCSLCGNHYFKEKPSDWEVALRFEGKCCSCGGTLEDSFLNMVNLDKYVNWKFPAWGNILARNEDKKEAKRAVAILCDDCIRLKQAGKRSPPIRFALEVDKEGEDYVLRYHDIKVLVDADPITEEDLEY